MTGVSDRAPLFWSRGAPWALPGSGRGRSGDQPGKLWGTRAGRSGERAETSREASGAPRQPHKGRMGWHGGARGERAHGAPQATAKLSERTGIRLGHTLVT